MNNTKILATAIRIGKQFLHDPRTLALVFIVPPVLMVLLKYIFDGNGTLFEHIAPMLLGIFPMIMMFLISSIATLRERSSGTLDRLMAMPVEKLDFILGYALAFLVLAFLQAALSTFVLLVLLKVSVLGGALPVLVGAVASAFLGTTMGLFTSAFASSEFQAVQFMPAFIFPQLLVCGLFVDRSLMAKPLQWFADILPLTYSVDALKQITDHTGWGHDLVRDLVIVLIFALVALVLGAATIRRQE